MHIFFSFPGSYIFIEASQRSPGEKARLLSGWIEPNETVCVQFWYHMHGSDIGNLSIYVKTNQSETLVWRLSGDQGNRWRFGQTALNSPFLFKVRRDMRNLGINSFFCKLSISTILQKAVTRLSYYIFHNNLESYRKMFLNF